MTDSLLSRVENDFGIVKTKIQNGYQTIVGAISKITTNSVSTNKIFSNVSVPSLTTVDSNVLANAYTSGLQNAQNINSNKSVSISNLIDDVSDFKVTADSRAKIVNLNTGEEILIKVLPAITETRNAAYQDISLLHHPGDIIKYQKTAVRTWSFSITLISRTPEEADENKKYVNWIRSWVMPYYGENTAREFPDKLGAPPPILSFSAFGENTIGPVKTVLENYTINWPDDVDYIQTTYTDTATPFPVILSVSVNLKEAYSPAEYSGFNLIEYKKGNLANSFVPLT